MKYKKYSYDAFNVYTIKTDKFKNCHMEIIFQNKIEKEKVTARTLLCDMLMYSSKNYPKRKDIVIALEELYCATVFGVPSRIGHTLLTNYICGFLNAKYCEEGTLEKVLAFPFELLLNPNITDDEFDLRSFKILKENLKNEIESLKEDPKRYALKEAHRLMDPDSPSSINISGYLEDLEKITPASLVKTYQEMLETDRCDIFVIGDLDMDYVAQTIFKNCKLRTIQKDSGITYSSTNVRKRPLVKKEKSNFGQSQLVMIFNLDDLSKKELDTTIHVFNSLFGQGSLGNKLVKYLREENSLCYTVSSMLQKGDRHIIVYAGIDASNFDLAVKLVKKALKEIQDGKFEDQELEINKKIMQSSLKMILDNQSSLINNYFFHEKSGLPLIEERMDLILETTKEEVMAVAKKIKLNTVYLLEDKGANESEEN